MDKIYVTGIRRGLGKYIYENMNCVDSLEGCDVFINCKHSSFDQIDLLYKAVNMGKRVINISSNSGDGIKGFQHQYAVQKAALDKANEQLFYLGKNTTSLRFGYFDTDRVAHIKEKKMSVEYVFNIIKWVLEQPHRVKEITITP